MYTVILTISQKPLKLIKNVALMISFLLSFSSVSYAKTEKSLYKIQNPYGKSVVLRLAITRSEHQKGLSGLSPKDFGINEGMLFINPQMGIRQFWMPDTYFNLAIIFLDQNLKIVGIEPNVPHHPGFKEPPSIYRTKEYFAQYVLETKTESPFNKKLKAGDQLKWVGKINLSEIGSKIHH
jgi:uncharacterized membrane protein (UPF0127 family)